MIRYEQENDSIYMVIDSGSKMLSPDYDIKMLENNNISSLLPVSMRCVDNQYSYYYDVTSKQQFSKIYEYKKLSRSNVENILISLEKLVNEINEYMLDLDRVILKIECIYVDMSKDRLLFAYGADGASEENKGFRQGVKRLFDYIIEHFDHGVKDADIMYVYNIYQRIAQGDYNASDFKELIEYEADVREESYKSVSQDIGIDKKDNILEFIPEQQVEDEEEVQNRTAHVVIMVLKSVMGMAVVIAAGRMFAPSYVPIPVSDVAAFIIMLVGACGLVLLNKIPLDMFSVVKNKKEMEPYTYTSDMNKNQDVSDYEKTEAEKNIIYKDNNNEYENVKYNEKNDKADNNSTILLSDYIKMKANRGICLRYRADNGAVSNDADKDIVVKKFPWIIGSMEKQCDTVVDSCLISHLHACIIKVDDEYYIEDMNSTNGTYVNGERLIMNSKRKLSAGDIVTLSATSYVVEMS